MSLYYVDSLSKVPSLSTAACFYSFISITQINGYF